MLDSTITTDQLNDVKTSFINAFNALYSKYQDTETLPAINKFVAQLSLQIKPWVLLTPDALQLIVRIVFENEIIRDFIMSLQFHFFSTWGHNDDLYYSLAANIGDSISINSTDVDALLIPTQITSRLTDRDECISILKSNKWLIIICLIQLFVTITDNKAVKK